MERKQAFRILLEGDRVIRGDWYGAEEPRGTVIVCHGYKGFKDYGMFPRIGQLLSDRWDVVLLNFSLNGVGDSLVEFTELEQFARNTFSAEQEDLQQVVKAVREGRLPVESGRQPANRPVFLLGHSKGGGGVLLFALDHPELVDGVISWNGISRLDVYSDDEKKAMRETGRAYTRNARTGQDMPLDRVILEDMDANRERFDLIGRIPGLRVPAVLIQGEKDSAHHLKGSARLVEAQPKLHWHLVPEGDHRFNTVHPYAGDTDAFLEAIRLTALWLEDWSDS
ncbi:alpha/beta hydrolase family protein [Gorillibacterium sp. sgz5001074]|uniref:alpha/beta hydrolase family protein n=1 Tax=Gorillibacterium sp. sgz5001074 TaxID=3446695 RepID=UPI003F661F6D